MFYEKCFRFQLLKKSNVPELLPASFFKVLPLSQKFNRLQLPHPWFDFVVIDFFKVRDKRSSVAFFTAGFNKYFLLNFEKYLLQIRVVVLRKK